ncbi:MAG: hypothetical protein IPM29_06215 [Planctomycetes bacterium]|nr:hypothetical protein [Planctomycetota bacterium]
MCTRRPTAVVLLGTLALSAGLAGQCGLVWSPGRGLAGASGVLYTAATWDPDGPGPAAARLVVGGTARIIGEAIAGGIASLDPVTGRWESFGVGVNNFVRALLAMPNGDLIAGGAFSAAGGVAAANVARWNGSAWAPIGGGLATQVTSLARMPNGDIVAGGWFAGGVARWDGSTWQTLGGGITATGVTMRVLALRVMPNGDLFAGGVFSHAGAPWPRASRAGTGRPGRACPATPRCRSRRSTSLRMAT